MLSDNVPIVMISSTILDLLEHRKSVIDACLRAGMFPKMMEHLPANDETAISNSFAMVDKADVYLGIIGFRYGTTPKGHTKSLTHLEFERAKERKIPCLLFFMDDTHPVIHTQVEKGAGSERLEEFKKSLKESDVFIPTFKSSEDLKALIIDALDGVKWKLFDQHSFSAAGNRIGTISSSEKKEVDSPAPPNPFVPHPYTLLRTNRLIGRQQELGILDRWATKEDKEFRQAPMCILMAIGGMGKSALSWSWFTSRISKQIAAHAGFIWWSFYEPGASFERFVVKSLAYARNLPVRDVQLLSHSKREEELFGIFNKESFVVVLDGIERLLTGYAGFDAPYLDDSESRKPEAFTAAGKHVGSDLTEFANRQTIDPRAGSFLRKLCQATRSRFLLTSRLLPADLEQPNGEADSRCHLIKLMGLSNTDALDLWKAYGGKGSTQTLTRLFDSFGKHPLLIKILASEVSQFREAPGDFDAWQNAHPEFDPYGLPIATVRTHVLEYALKGLSDEQKKTLRMMAGMRHPAMRAHLRQFLVRAGPSDEGKPFEQSSDLGSVLAALESRGLIGWDRIANRYDMHPIVRGVTWHALDAAAREGIYASLERYFEAMPAVKNYRQVNQIDDLTPQVERFHALIGGTRWDEAFHVLMDQVDSALLYRLCATPERRELFQQFFPPESPDAIRLTEPQMAFYVWNALGQVAQFTGELEFALTCFDRAVQISQTERHWANQSVALSNVAYVNLFMGKLYHADRCARESHALDKKLQSPYDESCSLHVISLIAGTCEHQGLAVAALNHSEFIKKQQATSQGLCRSFLLRAQQAVWNENVPEAIIWSREAKQLADRTGTQIDSIQAFRVAGTAALLAGDVEHAEEYLHHALNLAQVRHLVEESLAASVAVGHFYLKTGSGKKAREILEVTLDQAQRRHFRLIQADALNCLAEFHLIEKTPKVAAEFVKSAFQAAWCDGPPYTYIVGIKKSRHILRLLEQPEPTGEGSPSSPLETLREVTIPGWNS